MHLEDFWKTEWFLTYWKIHTILGRYCENSKNWTQRKKSAKTLIKLTKLLISWHGKRWITIIIYVKEPVLSKGTKALCEGKSDPIFLDHFGAFSVVYTKYLVIRGDKKIQTQKWWFAEKFWPQKLGQTKGLYT